MPNSQENYAYNSIGLLTDAGINLSDHKNYGIPLSKFAENFISSGLVLSDEIIWVCFHGIFDFAYLLKIISGENLLPENEYEFLENLKLYFPIFYDIKSLCSQYSNLQGSLSKLCQELNVFFLMKLTKKLR